MNREVKPWWKKAISILLPLIGLVFVVQSSYSIYQLVRKSDVLGERKKQLKQLEQTQEKLKKDLSNSYTPFFIEEEARNKLGLIKPGETLVYVEKDASTSGMQEIEEVEGKRGKKTVLEQWWDVFR
jgi:cell division protein FtsB